MKTRTYIYRVYFVPQTYFALSAKNVKEAIRRGHQAYKAFDLCKRSPKGKPVKVERLYGAGRGEKAIKSF